ASGFSTVVALGEDGAVPGRGRWSGLAVQIVDAPPDSAPPEDPAWDDALLVRPLPELVHASALPATRPDAGPLGFGGDAAGPRTIALRGAKGAIVVAGPRRSGVSTALRVLATGAARAGIPVLRLDSHPSSDPDLEGITVVDLRAGSEPLRTALAAHDGP